jgi:hypothetical protein
MFLEQLVSFSAIVSAVALAASVVYAALQIRHNTRAVRASAFQQVVNSFAEISFEISKEKTLVGLYLRAGREFAAFDELERLQYTLLLMSLLRRAENVLFQTEIHMLNSDHWSGIRNSIKTIVVQPGVRRCWMEIRTRFNPTFARFIDSLIASDSNTAPRPSRALAARSHVVDGRGFRNTPRRPPDSAISADRAAEVQAASCSSQSPFNSRAQPGPESGHATCYAHGTCVF